MIYPSVYFIILNWNQPELTGYCLDSIAQQDYKNFHVVLVDNGSIDNSVAYFRENYPWATLIEHKPNVGYSLGNNIGIEYALENGADYLFLLNNDTELHPSMLAHLIEISENDSAVGIVGPTMYYYDPPNMVWGGANYIDWRHASSVRENFGELDNGDLTHIKLPVETDYIDTCAILIKRHVCEQVGLMNGAYFINFDDLDYNVRIKNAGYKIMYVPQAKMWHKVSATMGQASPGTTYYMTRNSLLFFWSHAPGFLKIWSVILLLLRTIRPIAAWTIKREYQNELFYRMRAANLYALRDFFLGRFGRMGPEVEKACYGG